MHVIAWGVFFHHPKDWMKACEHSYVVSFAVFLSQLSRCAILNGVAVLQACKVSHSVCVSIFFLSFLQCFPYVLSVWGAELYPVNSIYHCLHYIPSAYLALQLNMLDW